MSLSEDEQRRLLEIETFTAAVDPVFARRLDLPAAARRRRHLRWACWVVLAMGGLLMMIGAGAAHDVISIGTVLAGGGAVLMLWSVITAHGLRSPKI